jgi:hypothetical protein
VVDDLRITGSNERIFGAKFVYFGLIWRDKKKGLSM